MTSKQMPFTWSKLTDGIWRERYDTVRDVTLDAIRERFEETGRMASIEHTWKKGDPNEPHIFWDSDVTKWIEGVAYQLEQHEMPELEAYVDRLIDVMERTQDKDGYLNTYFTVVEPGERFTRRVEHELYCAGHLIEAALAYEKATGKSKMLDIAKRYVALIDDTFRLRQAAAFDTPGHQEIELALFKLFDYTGEESYKLLAEYFINLRGQSDRDTTYDGYDLDHLQTHAPIREQLTAEGHAVRALYMFASVVDMAILNQDEELKKLCKIFYDNVVNKRMYITGAVGSTYLGESFTYDYHLPSDTAYAETCASIALALFARRMYLLDLNGRYADTAEQAMYNTVLGGMSISGDSFYYENPLKADVKEHRFYEPRPYLLTKHLPIYTRAKVFTCSCCPPNISRFISSVADFAYSLSGDTVYCQCYMAADSVLQTPVGELVLEQTTAYPYDGAVQLHLKSAYEGNIALRIPGWCESYQLKLNGEVVDTTAAIDGRGYTVISGPFQEGDRIDLILDMPVRMMVANPAVNELAGQVAVVRGPIVYCAEAFDNPDVNVHSVKLDADTSFTDSSVSIEGRNVPMLIAKAKQSQASTALYMAYPALEETVDLRLIPYFAWANRGENDMTVWFR